ncbi:opioid growth factor receptor isoform X2 [Pleurodeles waltl]|uniref:opioid growth factor receptor isoform X2 n=1 Tax=Pleurodeles waltl TaxID=8319 RepID=UPI003709547F
MQGEKHWHCRYDSTWEGDEEDEDEQTEERPKGQGKNTHDKKNTQRMNEGTFRHRNMRAAQDMQNYRHGYPDLEDDDEDSTDMPNLRFYLNQDRFQPNGVLIEELLTKWYKNHTILEQSHTYIQWLFPLREAGMNWNATPLSKKELEVFKERAEVKERFVRAYKLMLDFYGIELLDEQTGKLVRAQNYDCCFQNLNWHSHNNLRITRILKCLGEMGYEHFQVKLVKFFLKETLKERTLPSVKQSALDYFLFTVRDRQERRRLVHYAWKHYQPQDRFVWGSHDKLKRFKVHRKLPKVSSGPSVVDDATLTEATAGSTDPEGGVLARTLVVTDDETASTNNSHLEVKIEGESGNKSILEGSESPASEEGQEKTAPRPTESPECSEVLVVREASEVGDNRNPSVGDADYQDPCEDQSLDHSGTEALKEGKKRKLPGFEPDVRSATLQQQSVPGPSPVKPPDESEKLKNDSLNTESNQAKNRDDAPLPATKKKKVDEPKTEHLQLGEESSQIKSPTDKINGLFQDPVSKTIETLQTAQPVEGESLDMHYNKPASLPKESHLIKDDFSENKLGISQSTDESKIVQTCDSQHATSMPPQGKTQERNPKTQDLEKLKESHGKIEIVEETKNVTAEKLVNEDPPGKDLVGKTQVDNQGKVDIVCVEKTEADLALESNNLKSDPNLTLVCDTPPLSHQTGSAPLNGEQDPDVGSNESSNGEKEQNEYCDILAPINVTDEYRKAGNDGNEGNSKSLTQQQDSNTIHSPINMMETKSMAQLENSKPSETSSSVEESKLENEHEGSQTTEASVLVKELFRTAQVADAVNEDKRPVETVDSNIAPTVVANKGLSEQEGLKPTQTAEANSLIGHLDCQTQQVADVLGEPNVAAELPAQTDC